jgi:hypothetical protein
LYKSKLIALEEAGIRLVETTTNSETSASDSI